MKTQACKRMLALCLCLCFCAPIIGACAQGESAQAGAQTAPDAQTFFTLLMTGAQTDALYVFFSPALKQALSRDHLAALPGRLALYGAFVRFSGEPIHTAQDVFDIYEQRLVFDKGELNMTYTLIDQKEIAGILFQPVPPRLPDGVAEEDFVVGEGRFALPGMLTLPADIPAPVPAVVLVHGSGPSDRDQAMGATALFRDIARVLAQNGIAVLRYDKRTYAHGAALTAREIADMTVCEETQEDAILAGRLLRNDPRVDPARIFVVGHSMGAMLAPDILRLSGDLFAGAALLSGSPYTLLDISIAQNEAAIARMPLLERVANTLWLKAEIAKTEGLYAMDEAQLRAKTAFSIPLLYWASFPEDTAGIMLSLDKPFLILNGGRDFQVTDAQGIDAWREALDWAQRDNITILHFPELNHLLMRYAGDPALQYTPQEYDTPATLDEAAANALLDWLTGVHKNEGE